jgi:NitT/TauT family transport system permease protein
MTQNVDEPDARVVLPGGEIIAGAADVAPPGLKRTRGKAAGVLIDLAYPTLTLIGAVVVWELYVRLAEVPSYLLPTPSSAAAEMWEQRSFLLEQTYTTALETILGYILAVVTGVPLAIAIASSKFIEKSLYPLLVASQVFPKIALAPLFLIVFGFGITSKVVIVLLIAFFPIVLNGVIGLQSVETEKIYLAQSMGAGHLKTFWRIKLPHSLPAMFGGFKLAAIFAVVGAVVGEFIGADAGLGRTLLLANGQLNTRLLFAAIGYLTIFGVVFYLVVDAIERISLPWHISRRIVQ